MLLESNIGEDDVSLVLGFGTIHAKGTNVNLSEFKERFEFPDGNVIIKHKPKAGTTHENYDPTTCYFNFTERGTWKIGQGHRGVRRCAGRRHLQGQGLRSRLRRKRSGRAVLDQCRGEG